MDDLTEKLMEILSNKENIEKIKNLSSMINNSADEKDRENLNKENNKLTSETKHFENNENNFNNDTIPADVMQTALKLMPLLSSFNKDDENTQLLQALRPHLSDRRKSKLDESMKMMNMLKLLPVLKKQGIF